MPSQVSPIGVEHDLSRRVQELEGELNEARQQQAATSEILRVISSSPMKIQRVFAEMAASAARLCDAFDAAIIQVEGNKLWVVAHHGPIPAAPTYPLTRAVVSGRAVLDRQIIHIADLQAEGYEFAEGKDFALRFGHRTILAVPLIRAGDALGVISIRRTEVRPFTDRQIDLLKTFADQAVIAIENTRLFEEGQSRTRELSEALEYQTATAEVLGVISRSPTDVQPVFDAIASSAAKLCNAFDAAVLRLDRDVLRFAAHHGSIPTSEVLLHRGTVGGRAFIERRPIHVEDLQAEEGEYPEGSALAKRLGHRTTLGVPLLREGLAIGTILVRRDEVRPFSGKQIALLQVFADQAVIAIENARLFEEAQTRSAELAQSLEYQTAISDVLGVISRSPNELQPVLDTIVETAGRLCKADNANLLRRHGTHYTLAAHHGFAEPGYRDWMAAQVIEPGSNTLVGRTALLATTVHLPDCLADPDYTYLESQRRGNYRTILGVPLLRDGDPIGVLALSHKHVQPFTEREIDLVETFADQAVIAIENARLFEEVQARNRDLTALGDVGRAVSSTLDLRLVLKTIVDRAVELSGTDGGSIFYYREHVDRFELGETAGLDEEAIARFRKLDILAGQTGLSEAISQRQPLQVPDIINRPRNPLRDAAIAAGLRAALVVPLLGSEGPLGALVLQRRQPGEFPQAVVSLMQAFADQSAIALENARLFEEIARKSQELEIASQHKSQFVANMSHELRTPLAAILGYAELMQEGFYEPQGPKSLDALTRIRSNGKHLLGLINTVLDIAKIESGQFTLNMAEYAIESVVETVRSATESLAQNKKIALRAEVAKPLPIGVGDEQRLTQVLLNLVGNAIKFTDAGEVSITAGARNGHFAVSVTDTGPGIPLDQQDCIFEQFHQVDSSMTKAKGGTGLGLAIAKQIVEMHGGRIWVESTVGKGSTFQLEIPTRAEFRKRTL